MKKLLFKIKYKKFKGVTSLLFVLAVGIVLVVMIAGIAALTVREQRQASNVDLSNRALLAAESGVKAAVAKINTNSAYTKIGCAPGTDFSNILTSAEEITCIEVKSNFNPNYEGFAQRDRAVQIFMGPAFADSAIQPSTLNPNVSPAFIDFKWHSATLDKNITRNIEGITQPGFNYLGSLYPEANNYNNAASIEMSFVYWPTNLNISSVSDSVKVATIFFVPGQADAGFSAVGGRTAVNNLCEGQTNFPGAGNYKCTTIKESGKGGFNVANALGINPNDYNFAIRIKPRYADTHFEFQAYNSSNQNIAIKSAKAQIDVTAKVGNLYRRVKAEKNITPMALESITDSVLYAGTGPNQSTPKGICKNNVISIENNVVLDAPFGRKSWSCPADQF
jgi:type II secretory pathway pseudopilin PulG